MFSVATSEVVRLAGLVVRRIDAELAEAAVRNAESGVQAHRRRRAEEVRTLSDLQALESRRLQLTVAS
jgi:hypothetical protein